MTISDFFLAGGIVAWPLLAISCLSVALIIERCIFWLRIKTRQYPLIKEILRIYSVDCEAAMTKLKQNADLPIARIFLEALELEKPTPLEFRLALETATQAELPIIKRYNNFFQTVITVSPLLGLLGTILGLMRSFDSLDLGNINSTNNTGVTGGRGIFYCG